MNDTRLEQPAVVDSDSPFASWTFGAGVVLFYAAAFFLPTVFSTGVLFRRATNVLAFAAGATLTAADRRSGNVWILFGVGFMQYLLTVVTPDVVNAGPLFTRGFPLLRPLTVGLCCAAGGFAVLVATGALRREDLDPRVSLRYLSPFHKGFSTLERTQKTIETIVFFYGVVVTLLGWIRG
jgi:hypothetical protein